MSNSQYIYYNFFLKSNNISSSQFDYHDFIEIVNYVSNLNELKKEFAKRNLKLERKKLKDIQYINEITSFFANKKNNLEKELVYVLKNDFNSYSVFQKNGESFKIYSDEMFDFLERDIYYINKDAISKDKTLQYTISCCLVILICNVFIYDLSKLFSLFNAFIGYYFLGVFRILKKQPIYQFEFSYLKLHEFCFYSLCLVFSIYKIDFIFYFTGGIILLILNLFFYEKKNIGKIFFNIISLLSMLIIFKNDIIFEYKSLLFTTLNYILFFIIICFFKQFMDINKALSNQVHKLNTFYFNPNVFQKVLKSNSIEKFEFDSKESIFCIGYGKSNHKSIKIILDFYSNESLNIYSSLIEFITKNQDDLRIDFFFIHSKDTFEIKILQRLAQLHEYGEMNFLKALSEWYRFKDDEIWFLEFGEPYQVENYHKKLEYQEYFLLTNRIVQPCIIINDSLFPEEYNKKDIEKLLSCK